MTLEDRFAELPDDVKEKAKACGSIEEVIRLAKGSMIDLSDEEVEAATQALMAALEPVIILLMAGICGVIIGAVIAPMGALYSGLDNL